MEVITMLSGPVIGAVIGYFTNYIAVKMLFHPRNPVTLGGHRLPFTPGIIPKRKKALAKAIGAAVQGELFGEQEIKSIFLSDETQKVITDAICSEMESFGKNGQPIGEFLSEAVGSEQYSQKKESLEETLTDKVVQGIVSLDMGEVIAEKGTAFISDKMDNPLLAMFLTPDTIRAIAAPLGDQVTVYVETEGKEKIRAYVQEEIEAAEQKQPSEWLEDILGDGETIGSVLRERIGELYQSFVENHADAVVKQFKIREIIEERVGDMSNEALENLVLSVMKNELGMIVNLGAVIGAVIGILNSII